MSTQKSLYLFRNLENGSHDFMSDLPYNSENERNEALETMERIMNTSLDTGKKVEKFLLIDGFVIPTSVTLKGVIGGVVAEENKEETNDT